MRGDEGRQDEAGTADPVSQPDAPSGDNLHAYLAAIVESSEDAIIGKTPEGIITSWNAAAGQLYGYDPSEVIGRSMSIIIPADRADELPSILHRVVRGERVQHYETVRVRKDGTHVDVSISVSPIKGADGRIIGAATIARQITERKRAEEERKQLLKQVSESEARYRTLYSSMSEGVALHEIVYDEAGNAVDYRILGANPAFESITGVRRDLAIGGLASEVYGTGEAPYLEIYARVAETGEPETFETTFDPMAKTFSISAFSPEKGRFGTVFQDITERRRAEAERERLLRIVQEQAERLRDQNEELLSRGEEIQSQAEELRARNEELQLQNEELQAQGEELERLLREVQDGEERLQTMADAVPQLVWMANADGYLFWYNQRWYEYTGTTPEQMVGWGWQSVHDPEMLPEVMEKWKRSIATGERFEMDFPLRGADGRFRWFLTRVTPVKNTEGQVARWFGTNTDITERREAEAEREGLLAAERRARSEAESAARARDEFMSIAAHELKTPVTSLQGFAQIVLRDLERGGVDPARLSRAMQRIDQQSRRLTRLTEQLLNLARLEAGKLRLAPESADVGDLVESVVASMRFANQERTIALSREREVPAVVDPLRLEQVVTNLIDNAVKFSPYDSPVEVEVGTDEVGQVTISVRDHGIGIPEGERKHIFERFYQANPGRHYGGMGIGLFVSNQIVAMHGGTIEVEHPAGGGSLFVVKLPSGSPDAGEG